MPPRQKPRWPKPAQGSGPTEPGLRTKDADATTSYRPMGAALTLEEIAGDKLTKIAEDNWSVAARARKPPPKFDPGIVCSIYDTELHGKSDTPPRLKRVMMLEISQYLEAYLWPNFPGAAAPFEHVMSIICMINEKFRENVPAWEALSAHPDAVPGLFAAVTGLRATPRGAVMRMHEKVAFLLFAINAFQSLENEAVRGQVLKLVSLPLWHALSRGRLQLELHANEKLGKHWRAQAKKEAKALKAAAEAGSEFMPVTQRPEATFIPGLLDQFLEVLGTVVPPEEEGSTEAPALDRQAVLYCERFVEFLIDLLSQLPTRRFVHALLEDHAVLVHTTMAPLHSHPQGTLFAQLEDLLRFYMSFPIDNHTGEPQSDEAVTAARYARLQQLQRLFFVHHPQLRELALSNCGSLEKKGALAEALRQLPPERLRLLVTRQLRLVNEDDPLADRPEFLIAVMASMYEARRGQMETVNTLPLYPTENILWDENVIPSVNYTGETCLALPKLNLQFLTPLDYLLRNFNLFRLEATYEIREDIADVLSRVGAGRDEDDNVVFRGWARMATPIDTFTIIEVKKPNVGENKPAAVTADVVIDTRTMRGEVRAEWDELKQHDVLFLLTLRPPDANELQIRATAGFTAPNPADKFGLVYVRGCEVIEVKDEEGGLMNDFTGRVKREEWQPPAGTKRQVTLALDTAQYQLDMNQVQDAGSEDIYSTFNLLMRRKPKENNFKAVLESIRDLMNEDTVLPDWLHDIFLGYGDPAAAQYTHMDPSSLLQTLDFKDTFLDAEHLEESFPGYKVDFVNNSGGPKPVRPFRVTFPPPPPAPADAAPKGKRKGGPEANGEPPAAHGPPKLVAESYTPPNPGPYPQDKPPENRVRFTPVQVEAIRGGVQPGLTMVVGPPGTGKTDTAVQILNILYHNCPTQRTLVIAHSNQALNDLFEKILERDVPARYLLRLGMGEQELATTLDFSRVGRVNAMLARRLELLAEVEKMAKQLGAAGSGSYTCETAAHFWLLHVLSRWEKFMAAVSERKTAACVKDLFPFKEYFADAPQPLFKGPSYEEDLEIARGCFRHLRTLFQELEECRAFELLRGQADRVNYLMTRQAKVVAMTCTHAALKRSEFLDLGFKYDNLLMEESAQILEIETFIPLLLQRQEDGYSRLKRVVLIGDHHQLPPVVKNMAFQKYSHLDQSLFTRFVRLGTPFVQLNAQGRARATLAKLYNWRYKDLGDLQNVIKGSDYLRANPGFAYDYQFIDVPDYQGRGEHEPVPYFYQNLGEAELVVSLYQYMRLRGYPANKIAILTTYNGQKALLRDVIEQRCARHPAFGRPSKVTTVDKYQGQQNDYILLSLVRTRAVGHIRDVRRLVVAMSRARLGLYVFGRQSLLANCYELQPTFQQLLARPTSLALHPQEYWQDCKRPISDVGQPVVPQTPGAFHAMVTAMTHEWQVATYNAGVAAGGPRAFPHAGPAPPRPPPAGPRPPAPAGPRPMDVDMRAA